MAVPHWLKVLGHLAPAILTLIPGLPPILVPAITAAIGEAEQIPGASGPDKRQHVINASMQAAAAVNAVKPGAVDVSTLADTVGAAADATVGVVNLVHHQTDG